MFFVLFLFHWIINIDIYGITYPALKVLKRKKFIKNRDEKTKMYLIIISVIREGEMLVLNGKFHHFHYL